MRSNVDETDRSSSPPRFFSPETAIGQVCPFGPSIVMRVCAAALPESISTEARIENRATAAGSDERRRLIFPCTPTPHQEYRLRGGSAARPKPNFRDLV